MEEFLKDNERIDDLQLKNENGKELVIIQNSSYFCFGMDAVLLANMTKIRKGDKVLDLCTGNGIIPIILSAKSKASEIHGVEIQKNIAEMAERSLKINELNDTVKIFCDDLKTFSGRDYDVITCNPPYKKVGSGIISENKEMSIARNEICCNLEDVISSSYKMLKPNGRLYLIQRPERLCDTLYLMRDYSIEPKSIRFIHSNSKKSPFLFLVEGMKDANSFLKVEKPLYIYNENGEYTSEVTDFYFDN